MNTFSTLPAGVRLDTWPAMPAPQTPQDAPEITQLREELRKLMPQAACVLETLAVLRSIQDSLLFGNLNPVNYPGWELNPQPPSLSMGVLSRSASGAYKWVGEGARTPNYPITNRVLWPIELHPPLVRMTDSFAGASGITGL